MDAAVFRWVLIIIAVVLGLAIYLYGVHQSRLQKRSAIETFTREEIDSAFIEDEQLRDELDNLNQVLNDNESLDDIDKIQINPAIESQSTPFALPNPELFTPDIIRDHDDSRFISYLLRHDDFRLITGEEAYNAIQHSNLEIGENGFLEFYSNDQLLFQISSLTEPGVFTDVAQLNFSTVGFRCFIDLESCINPSRAYETMLKKIDELVRLLNVKVYKANHELLTISDVTDVRSKLG